MVIHKQGVKSLPKGSHKKMASSSGNCQSSGGNSQKGVRMCPKVCLQMTSGWWLQMMILTSPDDNFTFPRMNWLTIFNDFMPSNRWFPDPLVGLSTSKWPLQMTSHTDELAYSGLKPQIWDYLSHMVWPFPRMVTHKQGVNSLPKGSHKKNGLNLIPRQSSGGNSQKGVRMCPKVCLQLTSEIMTSDDDLTSPDDDFTSPDDDFTVTDELAYYCLKPHWCDYLSHMV